MSPWSEVKTKIVSSLDARLVAASARVARRSRPAPRSGRSSRPASCRACGRCLRHVRPQLERLGSKSVAELSGRGLVGIVRRAPGEDQQERPRRRRARGCTAAPRAVWAIGVVAFPVQLLASRRRSRASGCSRGCTPAPSRTRSPGAARGGMKSTGRGRRGATCRCRRCRSPRPAAPWRATRRRPRGTSFRNTPCVRGYCPVIRLARRAADGQVDTALRNHTPSGQAVEVRRPDVRVAGEPWPGPATGRRRRRRRSAAARLTSPHNAGPRPRKLLGATRSWSRVFAARSRHGDSSGSARFKP